MIKRVIQKIDAREASYLAVLTAFQQRGFAEDTLSQWQAADSPTQRDYNLAQEITYGSIRMAMALDYMGAQLSQNKKLSLKLKEKALLRTALYQHLYMDKVPLYAIADQSALIAKKYCHPSFAGFLNAILRKLETETPKLPQSDAPEALSIRFSFPLYYVKSLIDHFGKKTTLELLELSNKKAPIMTRLRSDHPLPEGLRLIHKGILPIALIEEVSLIPQLILSPDFYIQNATPAQLMNLLQHNLPTPKRILDLCAAPGGKSIAAHDLYPTAQLVANDTVESKLKFIKENFIKYQLSAKITHFPGEEFVDSECFDLIIVDAPCSNTGVLNKRPEARWRLSEEHIEELAQLQLKLLENASRLIAPHGTIWYMTCSILPAENEKIVEEACKRFGLVVSSEPHLILPNAEGWDGGYGCD